MNASADGHEGHAQEVGNEGQIGKVFGFPIVTDRIIPRLLEFLSKLPETHLPTLLVAIGTFVALVTAKRFLPRLPAALLAMFVAGIAVAVLGLEARGVAVLGDVPRGLPPLRVPSFPLAHLPALLAAAAGVALVLFTSGMLTSRSFAEKNRYTIDADGELAGFGAANIASALLFLTGPLSYVPLAALGVVLVNAALNLVNVRTLQEIWGIDRGEVGLSVLTMLGVVAVGAINAILVAVVLALLRFVKMTSRPRDTILGRVPELPGLHTLADYPEAQTWSGLVVYRFDGPITFFNSAHFRARALATAIAAGPGLRWFVLDAAPITSLDVTGMYAVRRLREELEAMGAQLFFAGRKTQLTRWAAETGNDPEEMARRTFTTADAAVDAFLQQSPT